MNRRDFLKGSAALAVAGASPATSSQLSLNGVPIFYDDPTRPALSGDLIESITYRVSWFVTPSGKVAWGRLVEAGDPCEF